MLLERVHESCVQQVRQWDHSWLANAPRCAMSSEDHLYSPEIRETAALLEVLGFQQLRVGQLEAASAVLIYFI